MPVRSKVRTRPCGRPEARKRLDDARKYLEVAELVAGEDAHESINVSVGLAVLAGIAAADAASCVALGESSRSEDHRDAADLLRHVVPAGERAAKDFERLVGLKDAAHYGFLHVSATSRTTALRRARALVAFAEATLEL
jgi:hypothetical protein